MLYQVFVTYHCSTLEEVGAYGTALKPTRIRDTLERYVMKNLHPGLAIREHSATAESVTVP